VTAPPGLAETLDRIADDLHALTDDWWLIGSAAMVLHGVALAQIDDVDILTTPAGARRLAAHWGVEPTTPGPSERFDSDVFFQRSDTPLAVEVMAGFRVKAAGGWTPVLPKTRVALAWPGGPWFAPSRAELLDMLALFGRAQDLQRAKLLSALPT
jgi:hypothetical protein